MSKSILLIITGSIAAYKSLDIIRRLREQDVLVTTIVTRSGAEFVTPLSIAALSGSPVYSELFSLKDETEMGHIRLSRESDLVAVIPASADILAKMATGRADDLASTALLATNKPVWVAPAMNHQMWEHPATRRNVAQLVKDGIRFIEPQAGDLACGEVGQGRLADVDTIVTTLLNALNTHQPLKGFSALVTSGPTYEPLDPVRFIGNRSSGKQGYAIAAALSAAGADVTLISGPTSEAAPANLAMLRVETAQEMMVATESALPADIAVCCAAVSDWRAKTPAKQKMKKNTQSFTRGIDMVLNPDILKAISTHKKRPRLVIGFAAETEALQKNAESKRVSKKCDWIVANNVAGGRVFGKDSTSATLITEEGFEEWASLSKRELAQQLVAKIVEHFAAQKTTKKKQLR